MATNRSKSAPKRETRTPVTFETAAQLCPHQGVAENVAQAFGLIVPEYDAIRTGAHDRRQAHGRGLRRLPQRQGDRHALPAHCRGPRLLRSRGRPLLLRKGHSGPRRHRPGRRGGDDEHGAPIGLESRAQRTREFAADMAMQAFALLAAAHGDMTPTRSSPAKTGKPTRPPPRLGREEGRRLPDRSLRGLTPPRGGGPNGLRPPSPGASRRLTAGALR